MTSFNNALNVMFARLILDGKTKIDDVPSNLKDGVQKVVDYFADDTLAEAESDSDPVTKLSNSLLTQAQEAQGKANPVITNDDEPNTTQDAEGK